MKRETLLTASVVMLLLLNLGTLGFLFLSGRGAEGAHGMREQGPGKPDQLIVEGLKLDDAQIAKFGELKREHHEAIMALDEKDQALHDTYFSLLKTDAPDSGKIANTESEMGQIDAEKNKVTFDHFRKLRNMLRDEQKQKFDQLINDMTHALHQRGPHDRGPQGPPPPPHSH